MNAEQNRRVTTWADPIRRVVLAVLVTEDGTCSHFEHYVSDTCTHSRVPRTFSCCWNCCTVICFKAARRWCVLGGYADVQWVACIQCTVTVWWLTLYSLCCNKVLQLQNWPICNPKWNRNYFWETCNRETVVDAVSEYRPMNNYFPSKISAVTESRLCH